MNRTTEIEWTEHTWNPFVGCTILSAGCTNCYAMRTAARLQGYGMPAYQGVVRQANGNPVWTGKINVSETAMDKPHKTREPSVFFVNSMSDFFHPDAPFAGQMRALKVMLDTPRHTYQVLTKRPERIVDFMKYAKLVHWPGHIWIGATVERHDFTKRIDALRDVPAHIRFLSVEPLIGPLGPVDLAGIHWVIVGGESGPHARPMKPEWAFEARDQCIAQRVPLFFKQWGLAENNPLYHSAPALEKPAAYVARVDPHGKGGALLDDKLWHQFPRTMRNAA
jgi:protein gp37